MKKFVSILVLCCCLLSFNISYATSICDPKNNGAATPAFALVSAPDGYVNVRKDNKIIDKLANGEIVFIFESVTGKPKWCQVDSPIAGQIHDSGLTRIDSFSNIPYIEESEPYSAEFANKDIRVLLKAAPFIQSEHVIGMEGGQVVSIDGRKDIYGTDGGMPQSEYTTIEVTFGDKLIELPKQAYQNLFEPLSNGLDYLTARVNYDQQNDTLYIHMSNSDAAGAYEALLVLKNKKFYRQYIGHGF